MKSETELETSNPLVYFDDDGDLNLEWIYDALRFGICIDRNITKEGSGWWVATSNGEPFEGGQLPYELMKLIG